MIRCRKNILKQFVFVLLFILFAPTLAGALNYTQPAFISNFYLTNKFVKIGNAVQPDRVLNALMADNPKEAAHIVVDFVGNKGIHNPEIEILDMNGRMYTDIIKVEPVTVKSDGGFFRIAPRVSGRFPEGGVYFKVFDTLDSGSRILLGMFGVMTVK